MAGTADAAGIGPSGSGKRHPCRDDGDGEFVGFFASARKADRDLQH